jgi:Fe2+ transport system protein B
MEVFFILMQFLVFAFLQSLFMVGIHLAMKKDEVLYPFSAWVETKLKKEWINKVLVTCVKCKASAYGVVTFFPAVIWAYGFHIWELPVFLFDVAVVSVLNFYIYQKV